MTQSHYLIWSMEHRAWWKPGGWGYTTVTHKAGRYQPQEAIKLCAEANRLATEELMVPAPDREEMKVHLLEAGVVDKEDEAFAPSPSVATPGKDEPSDVGEVLNEAHHYR